MSSKTHIFCLLSGLLAVGCSSDIYDSSVAETASLQLAVEWERQDAEVPLPTEYTALLPDVVSLNLSGAGPLLEELPTGASRLLLFNVPEGMTARGSVVSTINGGGNPGWLFTAAEDLYLRPLVTNFARMRMKQRTRELRFRANACRDITAVQTQMETASSLDVEYNRLFDPAPVTLKLAPDPSDDSFAGATRILGITGTTLDICFTFLYADASQRRYKLNVPADAFGGGTPLPSPLTIDLFTVSETCRAEIRSEQGYWQVELSQIHIDNNDPSAGKPAAYTSTIVHNLNQDLK